MDYSIYNDIDQEDLRKAQMVMLYIMKRIHEVCVKHKIKYWLDYGTLLGAIRHDGFIPWDDDMDICMMRDDYERFNQIAQKEFGEEFFWQTRETEPNYFNEFGRVRLNGTVWMQKFWQHAGIKHHGFFIDIFPQDPFPKQKYKIKFLVQIRILFYAVYEGWILHHYSPSFINKLIQKTLMFLIRRKLWDKLFHNFVHGLQKYKKKSNYVSTIGIDTERNLCDKALFDEVILKKFEDVEFYIPARYDERLKGKFGDYMQLPPEDQRYGHHGIIKIDFGKYKNL